MRHYLPKETVRLACVRHAASVHPEPGSNSPFSLASCDFSLTILLLRCAFRLETKNLLQFPSQRMSRSLSAGVYSVKTFLSPYSNLTYLSKADQGKRGGSLRRNFNSFLMLIRKVSLIRKNLRVIRLLSVSLRFYCVDLGYLTRL